MMRIKSDNAWQPMILQEIHRHLRDVKRQVSHVALKSNELLGENKSNCLSRHFKWVYPIV